ncbi:hypothetical protein [Xylella taiwanensis]|uniref:hypothetical protein n=1 Tax=Xylella taiwanensis TaxID=1444770 RepID=UPI003CCEABB8
MDMVITFYDYRMLHASSTPSTLGKLAVCIKIVQSNRKYIALAQTVNCYFPFLLSHIPLIIGRLITAFIQNQPTLHDVISNTPAVEDGISRVNCTLSARSVGQDV